MHVLWDLDDAGFADERIERKVDHPKPVSTVVMSARDLLRGVVPAPSVSGK